MHIDLYSTVQYYHIHAAVKFHRVTVIVIKIHGLMYSVVAGFRLSAALMVPHYGVSITNFVMSLNPLHKPTLPSQHTCTLCSYNPSCVQCA